MRTIPGNPKTADIINVKILIPTLIPIDKNRVFDKYIINIPSKPLNNILNIFFIKLEKTMHTAIIKHNINIILDILSILFLQLL